MLIITKIKGGKIESYNNFSEPNPYRLLMDVVKQSNWRLDMVRFTRFNSGVSARLDTTDKNEIVVQY